MSFNLEDFSLETLKALADGNDTDEITISEFEELYTVNCMDGVWNGEDRDFCDTRNWEWLWESVNEEIKQRESER